MLVPNTLASGLTSSDGSLTQSLRDTAASRVGPFTFYFFIDVVIKEKHCMFCENLNTVSLLLGPTSAFTVSLNDERNIIELLWVIVEKYLSPNAPPGNRHHPFD